MRKRRLDGVRSTEGEHLSGQGRSREQTIGDASSFPRIQFSNAKQDPRPNAWRSSDVAQAKYDMLRHMTGSNGSCVEGVLHWDSKHWDAKLILTQEYLGTLEYRAVLIFVTLFWDETNILITRYLLRRQKYLNEAIASLNGSFVFLLDEGQEYITYLSQGTWERFGGSTATCG